MAVMTKASQPAVEHVLHHLFDGLKLQGDSVLLYERHAAGPRSVSRRSAAALIGLFVRALSVCNVQPEDRLAFCCQPRSEIAVAEWGAIIARNVCVIIPTTFDHEDCINTLAESLCKLAFVDTLAQAERIAERKAHLPEMTHIIYFRGPVSSNPMLQDWTHFIQTGQMQPDRLSACLRVLTERSAALLFYGHKPDGSLKAERIDLRMIRVITENILRETRHGREPQSGDRICSSLSWDNLTGHIAASYLPLVTESCIEYAPFHTDLSVFADKPAILIGAPDDFDTLRANIQERIAGWGSFDKRLFRHALQLSKRRYESGNRLSFTQRIKYAFLNVAILNRAIDLLGGNLQLLISASGTVRYETQLFFYTLGVELVELHDDEMIRTADSFSI